MVLQNRLDYGFNGYQVPLIPRGTRSARRRRAISKKVDDRQMCAFDLLATVAGKLLLEGESSPSSSNSLTGTIVKGSIKKERLDEDNPSKVEPCGRRSCDRSSFVSELVSQTPVLHHSSKEFSHVHNDDCSGVASVITSDCSEKVGSAEKLVSGKGKIQLGSFASKVEVASSGYQESCDCTLEDENKNKKQIKIEPPKTGNASNNTKADMCSSDDLAVRDRKPPTPVSLDNSVKLPLCTDYIPSGSFPACRDDVKLVIRDDDENSSGCTQPSTATKAFRPPPRIGKRRIRKLLASKYWKVTPKLKDEEHFNADSETRSVYHNRKIGYKRKRSLTNYPIKKRIFYDRSSVSNSDGGISSEGISSSPRKGLSYSETRSVYHNRKIGYKRKRSLTDYPIKKRIFYDRSSVSNSDGGISSEGISSSPRKGLSCDASGSGATIHGASGTSACVAGLHTPFQSRDSHVKVRITSFKVPELFIEMPETATVGSLKRSVMEAVTAILGGGLRVGVLLQGKKIRDENKTLLQTGISRDNKLDALGFSLEPNPSQAAPPLCHEDHTFLLACDTPQPLTRYPPAPSVVHNVVEQSTADASPDPPLTNAGNFVDSDHDSAPSPPDMSIDKSPTDSRALVAVPAMNVEALSVVPMRKSKRSEAVQRRIRRPFSVSEVEALVQAVEKLGTGRWRDVKLRAFDNAKHRTYVDLKDKWKTLVHTARISPQQRRGEPVPQELLDRVLAAHAYWSQQQAKQQLKQQLETCLL